MLHQGTGVGYRVGLDRHLLHYTDPPPVIMPYENGGICRRKNGSLSPALIAKLGWVFYCLPNQLFFVQNSCSIHATPNNGYLGLDQVSTTLKSVA